MEGLVSNSIEYGVQNPVIRGRVDLFLIDRVCGAKIHLKTSRRIAGATVARVALLGVPWVRGGGGLTVPQGTCSAASADEHDGGCGSSIGPTFLNVSNSPVKISDCYFLEHGGLLQS